MAKYRKKPVVVDAFQWTPEMGEVGGVKDTGIGFGMEPGMRYEVKTLEGWLKVSPGDYIITGVQGEIYPCKPDIFEQTYDLVDELAEFTGIRHGDRAS